MGTSRHGDPRVAAGPAALARVGPHNPKVKFHSLITVRLGNNGEIGNVIDNTGGAAAGNPKDAPRVTAFP